MRVFDLLQLVVLVGVALLCGHIARKLKQPAVLGELIGGVILGPTIFGSLAPQVFNDIFLAGSTTARDSVTYFGLLAFLFVAGMEMNFANFRSQAKSIIGVSVLGIIVPFAVGFLAVHLFPLVWGTYANEHRGTFALFLATALSISALPVIARILMDIQLLSTKFGSIIMASAALNDVVGWALFAFVLQNHLHGAALAGSLKIPAILGAFLIGIGAAVIIPKQHKIYNLLSKIVMGFLAPIYFVSVGLKTNFIANFDWALVLIVFLIACLGKVVGATIGASFGKMPLKEALAVGFAMNARGAMEIVLATVALEYQLIDEQIFVALFIMAVATSMLSGPMIKQLLKKSEYVLN